MILYKCATGWFFTNLFLKIIILAQPETGNTGKLSLRQCKTLKTNSGLPDKTTQSILLPIELFPFRSESNNSVEVTLDYFPESLYCSKGLHEETTIDFNGNLQLFRYGNKEYFKEISFTDEHTLHVGGILYSMDEFCIISAVSMKSLTIQTCTRECSKRRPCIRRCCAGQQGIPIFPSRSGNDVPFSCQPTLSESGGKFWTPFQSKIIALNKNSMHFASADLSEYQTKGCKLLQLRESTVKSNMLVITGNGMLLFNFGNKSDVVDNFCIDGLFCKNQTSPTCSNAGEVVHVYACNMDENLFLNFAPEEKIKENSLPSYDDADSKKMGLPGCSDTFDQAPASVSLPFWFFADKRNSARNPVTVTLDNSMDIKCPHGHEISTIDFVYGNQTRHTRTVFHNNTLLMNNLVFGFYEFCVESLFHNSISIRTCKKICNKMSPCINRCCVGLKHVNLPAFLSNTKSSFRCDLPTVVQVQWNPVLFHNVEEVADSNSNGTRIKFFSRVYNQRQGSCRYYTNNPNENHFGVLEASPLRFLENGKLMLKVSYNEWIHVEENSYCVEPFLRHDSVGGLKYTGNPDDTIVRICSAIQRKSGYIDNSPKLLASLFFIFSLFYVTIAMLYAIRTDKDPVFRWSIIFCCSSMAWSYVALGYSRIAYLIHTAQPNYFSVCAGIELFTGMFTNFIFLSGFSWTTTISFDVWYSLTYLSPQKKSKGRIWWYGLFAFAFPGIIVGTGIALDLIYPNPLFTNIIAPAYGRSRCLFRSDAAPLVYYYAPLSLLLLLNLSFFAGAVFQLWKSKRTVSKSVSDNYSSKSFFLNLKLFLLMGLHWGLDILSWLATEPNVPPPRWTVAIDIITITQPALVFILLIWNKDNKQYFGSKYSWVKVTVKHVDAIGVNIKLLVASCFCWKCGQERGNDTIDRSNMTSETL